MPSKIDRRGGSAYVDHVTVGQYNVFTDEIVVTHADGLLIPLSMRQVMSDMSGARAGEYR